MSTKEVLEVLFLEICQASRKSNVEIYAVGDTGWSLLNNNKIANDVYAINVAIKAEDISKVLNNLKHNKNREIESIHNNKKMNGMYFRYVDISTTCYDLREKNRYLYNGIHVNIWVLKRNLKNHKLNKLLIISERCWECKEIDHYTQKRAALKMKILKVIACTIWKIMGENRGGRCLYNKLTSDNYKRKNTYRFNMPLLKICRITNDTFKKCRVVDFKGYKVKVFSKDSKLMKNYKKKIHNMAFSTIVNTNVSNLNYLEGMNNIEFFSNRWYRRYAKLLCWREKNFLPVRKIVWNSWEELYFSYYRFNLWDYYNCKRSEINRLYYNGNYKTLEHELSYYLDKLDVYDAKGKGLCFDYDFLKIALTILALKGKKQKALRIIKNIRIEHFESIGEYEIRWHKNISLNLDDCIARKNSLQKYIEKEEFNNTNAYIYKKSILRHTDYDFAKKSPFECFKNGNKTILFCQIKNKFCDEQYKAIHVKQIVELKEIKPEKIRSDAGYVSLAIIFHSDTFDKCRSIIYKCLDKSEGDIQFVDYDFMNQTLSRMYLNCMLDA